MGNTFIYLQLTNSCVSTDYQATKVAEAQFFAKQKEAEAASYAKQKEAEGVLALANAYAHLGEVLGGGDNLLKYLMLERGTYGELARANADAIRGLQPKINVWTTG